MENYNFKWENLGDIELGRPNLGKMAMVSTYRLMQYSIKAVLEKNYGLETANKLFKEAGKLAGVEFCKNNIDTNLPLNEFVAQLHDLLIDNLIGVLRIESSDTEKMSFELTVSEDLDCSGLPVTGVEVCDFDEGFLEGIFKQYTGADFFAKEIDCWASGGRTCRFTVDKTN